MNDHIKTEIALYLAGGLTESRNRQIEAHAAACEKCRAALTKAKAKQARFKRDALKKAIPDKMPNLFLTRQQKSMGVSALPAGLPKGVVLLLVLVAVGYWGYGKWSHRGMAVEEAPVVEAPEAPQAPAAEKPAPPPVKEVTPPPPPKPAAQKIVAEPVTATTTPKVPLVLPVLQSWSGPTSAVHDPRLVVARNRESFEKLWGDMQLTEQRPALDFTSGIVLAIFAGPSPTGTTIDLGRIEEMGEDAMVAPFRVRSSTATDTASYPYLIAVVPRTDRKIKLSRRD